MDKYIEIQGVISHLRASLGSLDSLGLMAASACVCAALHHIENAESNGFLERVDAVDFSEIDAIADLILR